VWALDLEIILKTFIESVHWEQKCQQGHGSGQGRIECMYRVDICIVFKRERERETERESYK